MRKNFKRNILLVASGILEGAVNGLFGGGGGMIAVPSARSFLKIPQKNAHATALFIMLPVSAVSALLYVAKGSFELSVGLPACLGAVIGGGAGALLLKNADDGALGYVFAAVVFAAGVRYLLF